jgi:replicative DNA helicase
MTNTTTTPSICPTGFPEIDQHLAGGWRSGTLNVVTGDLKSAWMIQAAVAGATAGHPQLIFTMGMSAYEHTERAYCQELEIDSDTLDRTESPEKAAGADRIGGLPIEFEEEECNPDDNQERIKDWVDILKPTSCVWFDDAYVDSDRLILQMKYVAKRIRCAIVIILHPMEFGQISPLAATEIDAVIDIHRPRFDPDERTPLRVVAFVNKHPVELAWHGCWTKFKNM